MCEEWQEVEVKLYTPDLNAVKKSLEAAKAIPLSLREFEKNIRYDRPDGSLTAAGIVLRLRRDRATRLTYKADASIERGIVSRFEAEVEVFDFDSMDMILKRLGYEVALIYEKYRTAYTFEGSYIVLDELPYGNFTEIEGDETMIELVIEALGLVACRRMVGSYVDIFLDVKARLGLDARDCTFETFRGVDVQELI
ncbi:MAG: class IV adenylate cyclase [Chloroflexota bacterium]|nr:class IV adenylate cyclase [Chloroflexota bacterium]MDE2909995.1 class IV adenylate cyclase [Chloroflexota bacterium]